jgi:toxin HigB-1
MIRRVELSKVAERQVGKAPVEVRDKLLFWALSVAELGLAEVRKRPGFHDEPLRGDRAGQRSVRLNRQWRAIYVVRADGLVQFVSVEEVTPHAY